MNDLLPTGTIRYEYCKEHDHHIRVHSAYFGDTFVSVVEELGGKVNAVVSYKRYYPDGNSFSWDNHEKSGSKEEIRRWIQMMLEER